MTEPAGLKTLVVYLTMAAAAVCLVWLPLMRIVMQRAVTAGTYTAEHGRATLLRVSMVPLFIAIAIVYGFVVIGIDVPPIARYLGFAIAAAAIVMSFVMRQLAARIA